MGIHAPTEQTGRARNQGVKLYQVENYVDDTRAWVSAMRKGTRFLGDRFTWSPEAEKLDEECTSEDVTFREVSIALNSISDNLKFTFERPSEFEDDWLPTLDFKVKVDLEANRYTHTYYEKPMNTKWVLPFISAMDSKTQQNRSGTREASGSGSRSDKSLQ